MAGKSTKTLIKDESLFIVIPLGFTGGQLNFPDDQYIRNKKLMSIELIPDLSNAAIGVPQTRYVDGKPLANLTTLQNAYITLESYSGVQFIRKRPVLSLLNQIVSNATNPAAVTSPPEFVGQKVNWPKSYIEFPTIPATGAEEYCLFQICFTELSKKTLQAQLGVGFQQKK